MTSQTKLAQDLELARLVAIGNVDHVRQALDRGVSLDSLEMGIGQAVASGWIEITRMFLEHGASPSSYIRGQSLLALAIRNKQVEMVELLIEAGADLSAPTSKSTDHLFPLSEAANHDMAQICKRMIQAGACVETPTPRYNRPPIFYALYDLATVDVMVEAGANVNVRDANGMTPLHLCSNERCVERLLEAGADPNARNLQGETPLVAAVQYNMAPKIQLLLEAGADPYLVDGQGRTAFQVGDDAAQSMIRSICESRKLAVSTGPASRPPSARRI